MSSGDVGYLDDAGRLFVVGRDDEMIVSGGENVYPIEVEKTLAAHPEVAEAAVIGVDDEQYGQRLAAFVVLDPAVGGARHPQAARPGQPGQLQGAPRIIRARRASPRQHRQGAAQRTQGPGQWLMRTNDCGVSCRKPRPLTRAAVELLNAANGLHPIGRNPNASVLEFWSGWPTSEVPRLYFAASVLDALRRGRRGDFAGRRGKAALALTAASWAILGVIRYRGDHRSGAPVLEAG